MNIEGQHIVLLGSSMVCAPQQEEMGNPAAWSQLPGAFSIFSSPHSHWGSSVCFLLSLEDRKVPIKIPAPGSPRHTLLSDLGSLCPSLILILPSTGTDTCFQKALYSSSHFPFEPNRKLILVTQSTEEDQKNPKEIEIYPQVRLRAWLEHSEAPGWWQISKQEPGEN